MMSPLNLETTNDGSTFHGVRPEVYHSPVTPKRFNKKNRDFGKLAIEKTKVIERITNKGGKNAGRCIEIASGSPLTEAEINATKKSEINPECPSIANPKYIPH